MSSGGNGKMLDTGYLYEVMKAARPVACPVPHAHTHAHTGATTPGGSPTATTSASPTAATTVMGPYDAENNLNKGSNGDKCYMDKHVLNIDKENYMMKYGPTPTPMCLRTSGPSSDQVRFNVTTSSECRNNALTCRCRPQSCGGSVGGGSGPLVPYSTAGGPHSHSNGTSPNQHNVCHTVSSLLPLVECRACFHNVCTSFTGNHPCSRPQHTIPPPTVTTDVVSTTLFLFLVVIAKHRLITRLCTLCVFIVFRPAGTYTYTSVTPPVHH